MRKTRKCEPKSRMAVNKNISQVRVNVGINKKFKAAIINIIKDKGQLNNNKKNRNSRTEKYYHLK